jgi:hypothetical protein
MGGLAGSINPDARIGMVSFSRVAVAVSPRSAANSRFSAPLPM